MTEKKWLKITIKTDPVLVESISDFLIGVTHAGVETGARDELLYGTVNGYIEKPDMDQTEMDTILNQISSHLAELAIIFDVPEPILSSTMIEEEDWGKNWKEHFKPFAIVPGLVIAPTWEEYQPLSEELVITMDPGMAFGTGHHATTFLCLGLIQETLAKSSGIQVLDVGTGTGILGMAAALFGAETVLGIDNDPEAVSAAHENVSTNSLEDRMQVSLAPIESLEVQYDVVVANIVHDVLIAMADDLTGSTKAGGTLILSGLLAGKQVENIQTTFESKGFVLIKQENRQEWSALQLLRNM